VLRRARRAQHDVLLGKLRSNKVLAASRIKRWWMAPSWPLAAGEVPIETQFALVGLPNDAGYAVNTKKKTLNRSWLALCTKYDCKSFAFHFEKCDVSCQPSFTPFPDAHHVFT